MRLAELAALTNLILAAIMRSHTNPILEWYPSLAMAKFDENPEADEGDSEIAKIIEDLSLKAERGESVDINAVAKQHPEIADDLREVWGALLIANAVTRPSSGDQSFQPSVSSDDTFSDIELPCRFGDYELLEEIGRGGMGMVFKARHQQLNRIVAIKMLLRGRFASAENKARFHQEAQSAAGLHHPGIVSVFEVGEQEDRMYFSMPLIDGETLANRLERGRMPQRRAAKLVAEISNAVEYAHQQGVLHRDLKPSNVLIDHDGNPHITDFGLARPIKEKLSLTRTGAVIGTPAFMSPEQAAGNSSEIGPASDVYSLGTILYNAITGEPPFRSSSPVDLLLKVIEQDPSPPRLANPRIDRDLEMITLRCLQKPPELRYDSAGELAEDLACFLRGEPVQANSGRLSQMITRFFRETHHAPILENWGALWVWHSFVLSFVAILSDVLRAYDVMTSRLSFFLLWFAGLTTWGTVFWTLRRKLGPVTFVERQIAHIWVAGIAVIFLLMPLEHVMGGKLMSLSPMLAFTGGMVFLAKAGILSGEFYVYSACMFVAAFLMGIFPSCSLSIFGVSAALGFFFPGLKYYRMRKRRELAEKLGIEN